MHITILYVKKTRSRAIIDVKNTFENRKNLFHRNKDIKIKSKIITLITQKVSIIVSFSIGVLVPGTYAIARPSMCAIDVAKKSRLKMLTSHRAINGTLKIVATVKITQYVLADDPARFLSKNITDLLCGNIKPNLNHFYKKWLIFVTGI